MINGPESTIIATDADYDAVLTAEDCDDTDGVQLFWQQMVIVMGYQLQKTVMMVIQSLLC